MSSDERGSASIAIASAFAICLAATLAVSSLGLVWSAAVAAANGADAAALAAAVATFPPAADAASPSSIASELAELNRTRLVSCVCPIDTSLRVRVAVVVVAVDVDVPFFGELSVERTARAEFDPQLWLGR